jgi:flagellar hook-associated protein FlgK
MAIPSIPTAGVSADNPLAPEYLALERQKKIADLLMQKGQELPQAQMVSGYYVPPSWTQQLGTLANAYMGGKMAEQNEAKTAKLAQLLRSQNEAEIKNVLEKTFGSPDYKPAVMPEIQRDDMGNVMPAIQNQIGVAPNREAALLAGLTSTSPIAQAIGQNLLSKKLEGPKYHNVAQGASVLQETPEGMKPIYTNPKEVETPDQIRTAALRLGINPNPATWTLQQRMAIDEKVRQDKLESKIHVNVGGFGEIPQGDVNNNGLKVGKYDKTGRYINPKGEVFSSKAMDEARKEHDAATDLAYKLDQLSENDIKNAYGSLTDYTTSKLGRMAGSTATVNAQTKINNLQIGSVLNNLSQLKGASSDKEMAQMIKDFPGYEASPEVMNNWVRRAADATNRFLKRSENRYQFDTEYANTSIGKPVSPTPINDSFSIREKK